MSLNVICTHFWPECNIDKWQILKWCSYFWGQLTRIAVSQEIRSIPTRGFRNSGASSNLIKPNSWWNNRNSPLLLLTESLPKGAAAGPCPLPAALSLTFSETGQDAPLSCPVILPGKEDYLLLSGKSPEYLVPAHFVPQTSRRTSVLWLLVSCLLYFVDQPYLCLADRYSLSSAAVLVWPCILLFRFTALLFGNWLSSPSPKQYFPWVPSLPICKCTESPCSACTGDAGAVITSVWPRVVEVNRKRPREFQLVLGQPPSDWPNEASNNILN